MRQPATSLPALQARVAEWSDARGWRRHHTPKNLSTALAVEAAELLELYQWVQDGRTGAGAWPVPSPGAVREEMADICIYLLLLARETAVDLSVAVEEKLAKNSRRYPSTNGRRSRIKGVGRGASRG